MKKRIFKLSIISIIISFSLIGCGKKLDYNEINTYSDEILSSILTSLCNNDYDTFSSYLSDEMISSYGYETFQKESASLITNAGIFKSLKFDTGEKRNGYIFAIYDTEFTDEPEGVRVSILFKEDDPSHKVYELYLDSPKLSEANKNY